MRRLLLFALVLTSAAFAQDDKVVQPLDDSSLDESRAAVVSNLPKLKQTIDVFEQLLADSAACTEAVPTQIRSVFKHQHEDMQPTLADARTVLKELENEPLNAGWLYAEAALLESARLRLLRWAAVAPSCKPLQAFAQEQFTLPIDSGDPILALMTVSGDVASTRDAQVQQLRLLLKVTGPTETGRLRQRLY